jgi:uncharacterized membrane protein (DUF441 family)
MWGWTLVRFVHLTAAAIWLGMQVTLLVLVPTLRRTLPPDTVRGTVRRAGPALAITGGLALAALAASGVALGRHDPAAAAHPGVVHLKQGLLIAIVVLLTAHAGVHGRWTRLAASALMLVLTLAAVLAGAWLAES